MEEVREAARREVYLVAVYGGEARLAQTDRDRSKAVGETRQLLRIPHLDRGRPSTII